MPVSRGLSPFFLILSASFALAACATSPRGGFEGTDAATEPPATTSPAGDFGTEARPATTAPVAEVPEVFGHSATTLYRLDPDTKAVTVVGAFKKCAPIIDIAVDEAGQIFGVSNDFLYKIDKTTATCTQIGKGSYPNSLSFVPQGTLDASAEALVGYDQGDYIRIDVMTGTTAKIGTLGSDLKSSGDIVSVKGGASYLTVKGASCDDCLVEVDPKTGVMTKQWGDVFHADVFGLAFWAGKVYGFSRSGDLFEVTFGASTVTTQPITIPSKPGNLQFWGAGSSTLAPLMPTPH